MDQFDGPRDHIRIGSRQHTVPQVEDVPGRAVHDSTLALGDDASNMLVDRRVAGEKHCGIEVSLHCDSSADPARGIVEGYAPVDADHVGSDLGHGLEQLPCPDTEVDAGHAEIGDLGQHARTVWRDEGPVVGIRQRTGPRIEELDRVDACVELGCAGR